MQESGQAETVWATHDEQQPDDLPQEVQHLSEAVLAARTYLGDWLVVPEGVDHELPTLDTTPNGFAWGNTTYRGLRALATFAEARSRGFDGDFWRWCERGEPLAWPATTKKLSMRESETVANRAKFVQARLFPIDTQVSADGTMYMEAHLKISEGSGDLAPRVYFHDVTAGATCVRAGPAPGRLPGTTRRRADGLQIAPHGLPVGEDAEGESRVRRDVR